MSEPVLIKGGFVVDDRGCVSFVNNFDFFKVKRFYIIQNHCKGFIRAWHGHKYEEKYFFVINGAALICGIEIDNWESPSEKLNIYRFILSDKSPAILYLPANYANGTMSLTEKTKIMVFSSMTLEESMKDDIRFPSRFWNPWEIEER